MSLDPEAAAADAFIQKLHDDPEQIFSSYKTQTAKEIFAMVQFWKEKKEDGVIVPERLLETFMYHIGANKVPKVVKVPKENDGSARAWSSFKGLEAFFSEFKAPLGLCSRLMLIWRDGIFPWCCYFYAQRIALATDPDTARTSILTIVALIGKLIMHAGGENYGVIAATPGITSLCTHLAIHPDEKTIEACSPLSLLSSNPTWDYLDEIVVAADGKPGVVAKAFVDRLRLTIETPSRHSDRMSTLAMTLKCFMEIPHHPLAFAILADNGAWVVARMLAVVSPLIGPSLDPSHRYFSCTRAGLDFLRASLLQYDSPRLVAQAVDAGLLSAICVLGPLLDNNVNQSCRDSLRFILRDILPKSMMYRSVIKVIKHENKEMDGKLPDNTIMRTSLREEWMSFLLLLYLRITVAKFPKELKGKGNNVSCDCITCDKRGRKSELMRCGGCLYVYYCSKTCQKEARTIHREMCKLKKHSNLDGTPRALVFTPQDAQYLREVVATDANIHHPHLQKLAKREFPNEPEENFIICIDYTDPLYPTGTCSLKNIKTYVFPPVSGEAADPANVRAQNNEMIKMVRRNPKEYTFIEATFAYGERRLTRNLMLRPNFWVKPPSKGLQSALNWQNNKCANYDRPAEGLLELFLAMNIEYANV
ncbi:hypothetical protein DFH07DRAFT_925302 [Mycena maculata]|uniref:MYND-type domain-containing protein n=1 Tax=Mycena maculata TaxID=230809 RepID=A0AAD7IJK6_9AGAR|nr:hypothetical protein DFH07DRAFT_925302 [Mycena maculata]